MAKYFNLFLGIAPVMATAFVHPFLDMKPWSEVEANISSPLQKRDDIIWSLSFNDGGCGGPASYGAYSDVIINDGACYNLVHDKPWDSMVLGIHGDFEMFLYSTNDCCLGPDNPQHTGTCHVYHDSQEGTCISGTGPYNSVSMSYVHDNPSPNGAQAGREECSIGNTSPGDCPNDRPPPTAMCTLTMTKQLNTAVAAGASPQAFVDGTLSTDQTGDGDYLLESCSSAALEGHYNFRKDITHMANDIDVYITGQSGKTLDGYFEYYLHGEHQHIDFNTCEAIGTGYVGFSYGSGDKCTFPCDLVEDLPPPPKEGATMPNCFHTG